MSTTVVETQYGKVQGTQNGPVYVWKGIPFAQPPTGRLRFHAPQPPQPWAGIRDATQFGLTSAQASPEGQSFFTSSPEPSGEDCLYLNIWSPGADDKRRPVMFWIHGGAFVLGSGSIPWYDGTSFASQGDVVVVTINYRLGALGFLYLADQDTEGNGFVGNCGLLDQIAALQWVRDNIAAFGGNPDDITIFGESAGAMSVGTLLGMPAAQGLFKKAILESGAAHAIQTREKATEITQHFLAALGTSKASDLLAASVEQLLEAQSKVSTITGGLAFQPVVDGITLPQPPIEAIAHGSADGVSLLIGTNRNEMTLFTLMNPSLREFNMSTLEHLFGARAATVAATYEAAQPDHSQADAWIDILTDRTFRIPAIRLAERQATRGNFVWMYRFDWPTPAFGGYLKACHALEIPFVWNNLDKPGVAMITGDAPTRQQIADVMHPAWIAFARHGNPNTTELPQWPGYDITNRATLLFNEECQTVNDPQAAERQLWDGVM